MLIPTKRENTLGCSISAGESLRSIKGLKAALGKFEEQKKVGSGNFMQDDILELLERAF